MEPINIQKRDLAEKPKRMRRNGIIPAVIFGSFLTESIPVQMEEATARMIVRTKREGSRLNLKLDGELIPVQVKEKVVNTLNNDIVHLTFQALKKDEKINSVIHIVLKNRDKVTETLETMRMVIPYSALPGDMIDTVTVDLDGMPVGTLLKVEDIPELLNDKIELQCDLDEIVLRISDHRNIAAPEEAAATEEV